MQWYPAHLHRECGIDSWNNHSLELGRCVHVECSQAQRDTRARGLAMEESHMSSALNVSTFIAGFPLQQSLACASQYTRDCCTPTHCP